MWEAGLHISPPLSVDIPGAIWTLRSKRCVRLGQEFDFIHGLLEDTYGVAVAALRLSARSAPPCALSAVELLSWAELQIEGISPCYVAWIPSLVADFLGWHSIHSHRDRGIV